MYTATKSTNESGALQLQSWYRLTPDKKKQQYF